MLIRQPIITVMGHVDHGKTTLLDFIRKTAVAIKEPGKITQHISVTEINITAMKAAYRDLLDALKLKITIPGLLFIDTPGHAAFTNLRKRGGNLADISILVIDLNEGLKPQTLECIEILKQYKTPFVIAANKIDLLQGWQRLSTNMLENIKKQGENLQKALDAKIYELVGKLSELGFDSERFDRVSDYTKQVAIIPISAKTGLGIPELLMVITGLAQKYLEASLKIEVKGAAKGTVLEVKKEKAGTILDIVVYNGCLKINDTIVIGGINEAIVTKVRGLFKIGKTKPEKEIYAASGARIIAQHLKDVVAGMPLLAVKPSEIETAKEFVQKEIEDVLIETGIDGIIIKADTLGSLEAMVKLLKEKNIPIRRASIGIITKKDLIEAESNTELNRAILAFNILPFKSEGVKIICHDVIYKILEEFELWLEAKKKEIESHGLAEVTSPFKIEFMRGFVFRQNNPAVIGAKVLGGVLKSGVEAIKEDGSKIGAIKSMQLDGKTISQAEKGKEIAIALPKVTVERQIKEGDIFYSDITEEDFIKLKEMKKHLTSDEIEILKDIAEIKRKQKPMWGI